MPDMIGTASASREHTAAPTKAYFETTRVLMQAAFLLLIVSSLAVLFCIFLGPLRRVPGPLFCKISGLYLSYYDILLKRTDKVHQWHQKYGPVICIGPGQISISDLALMKEIYGVPGQYEKSSFFDHFTVFGERPLFAIISPSIHRRKRQLISSFYNNVSLHRPGIEDMIQERVQALVCQIDHRTVSGTTHTDFYSMANFYAFDNITRVLYGVHQWSFVVETEGEERRILEALKRAQFWGPLEFDFPWTYRLLQQAAALTPWSESFKAEEWLMRWSERRSTDAIADSETIKDDCLLSHMLQAQSANSKPLSKNYIAAELYDNLNAAQVTVAVTLTYIVYRLSINPAWQSKIRNEMQDIFAESSGAPSFSTINVAPTLDAFIREVQRLHPGTGGHAERVVPVGGRIYAGIFVPEGVRSLNCYFSNTRLTVPDPCHGLNNYHSSQPFSIPITRHF